MPRPLPELRRTIAAPAPSPNRIAVERSWKSVMVDSFSAPTTSTVRLWPDAISPSATVSAYTNPGQAALTSNAAALLAPSRAWRSQAVDGSSRSGLAVPEDDAVELGGGDAGALHRQLAGLPAQHRDALLRPGDPSLPDPGALDDPLVGGVEHLGEIVVGDAPAAARRRRRSPSRRRVEGSCLGRGFPQGELRPDVLAQAGPRGLHRDPDRVADRVRAGGAVADDGDAAHAEQRRAAVGARSRGCG